ncbi:TetR/AcrR family transcriptional regulator [Variovorax ginsengisoli]|uniref:AcrR family transcriptional regulator n=1 Tax=Variovorax ginsengisoli TaxID=363844 RepID=A0ABT9S959_9BURK|nr:TetR family transcriptional regulator [Variovorax ginsengisoli]MDP9900893.1 AcrR family transcriptional regulator [Variovorax ginsengisoli]
MRRPSKSERDELRRLQIVTAAQACVLRHGFHAASMGQIASQAQMSVGQIYRYFANKEAIVHAIVEHIVSRRLVWIGSTGGHEDLPSMLARRALSDEDAGDQALMLEVTAEASRNPAVAAMVRTADERLHAHAVAVVRRDHPHLQAADVSARVELIAVLIDGAAVRRLTAQQADTAALATLYREVIERLLPGDAAAPGKR